MMFLIILLFCSKKCFVQKNYYEPLKLNTYSYAKKTSGNDERYPSEKNETEILSQLYKLRENIEKKHLLDILKNDKVSIYTKLSLVKDNSIQQSNINAGGLNNEFD
jgi:hypothetical protein